MPHADTNSLFGIRIVLFPLRFPPSRNGPCSLIDKDDPMCALFPLLNVPTGCSLEELWNLSAPHTAFLADVSLLDDTAQYPSCDADSVGSVVLVNTTFSTATVAYYSGTTAGSRACFVCDESSGYELSTTTTTERVCERNALWSGSALLCGMIHVLAMTKFYGVRKCTRMN